MNLAINKTFTLGTQCTGGLEYLIIPLGTAAPSVDTDYFVGGDLSYSLDGEDLDIPMIPAFITVVPDASLTIRFEYNVTKLLLFFILHYNYILFLATFGRRLY